MHDAWHTAATVLLLLGVPRPDRTVMGLMGWSNTAMAARYQHIIAAIRRDVATKLGGLLWAPAIDDGEDGRRCGGVRVINGNCNQTQNAGSGPTG